MNKLFPMLALLLLLFSTVYSQEKRIAAGTVVNITVLGYPELSQSVVVRQDGTVEYPLLASIPIFGMTQTELSDLLFPLLTRYVERPRLFIYIAEHKVVTVRVQGQVRTPGLFTTPGPLDIQGALYLAGGPTEEADLSEIIIHRRMGQEEVELHVDLRDYFEGDAPLSSLPLVEEGDLIMVRMLTLNSYIRVMGSVRLPGTYVGMKGGTIADMINLAGGANQVGNLNDVIHITKRDGVYSVNEIKLKKIISHGETPLIPLAYQGDIIIVNEYIIWKRLSFWSQFARDLALLISSAVIVSRL